MNGRDWFSVVTLAVAVVAASCLAPATADAQRRRVVQPRPAAPPAAAVQRRGPAVQSTAAVAAPVTPVTAAQRSHVTAVRTRLGHARFRRLQQRAAQTVSRLRALDPAPPSDTVGLSPPVTAEIRRFFDHYVRLTGERDVDALLAGAAAMLAVDVARGHTAASARQTAADQAALGARNAVAAARPAQASADRVRVLQVAQQTAEAAARASALQAQQVLDSISRMVQTISAILRAAHDIAMSSIRNIRA